MDATLRSALVKCALGLPHERAQLSPLEQHALGQGVTQATISEPGEHTRTVELICRGVLTLTEVDGNLSVTRFVAGDGFWLISRAAHAALAMIESAPPA